MFKSKKRNPLRQLTHDLRGHVHTARLNLEAAQSLARKSKDANSTRLQKHLEIVTGELEKLQERVSKAADQLS